MQNLKPNAIQEIWKWKPDASLEEIQFCLSSWGKKLLLDMLSW
jgi:hypothetical protein